MSMSRGDPLTEPQSPDAGRDFETFLAGCIEALTRSGSEGLEACLRDEPELATRVRSRIEDLAQLGLLDEGDAQPARIGGHRVLAQLGRGGMSAVYLAEDERGQRVALKLAHLPLDSGGSQDSEARDRARARFEREVRTVTRLDHPRLVAVRAAGEYEGRPWFSMDYVHGATLALLIERLRARGVPPESVTVLDARSALAEELEAAPAPDGDAPEEPADSPAWSGSYLAWCARVCADVATALEHAHAAGVVHRDVKAANVLLRPDGRAQLFDLGLAQVADQPTLTRSGDFAGTPYAVAPEQIDAHRGELDARVDVWGLGVTLYELVTLRRPFEALGPAAQLQRILEHEPTPPRRHHPGLPRDLENVLATALEKDPRRRYPSMTALREDLEHLALGRPVRARGAGPLRRLGRFARARPAHFAAASLSLLLILGVPAGLLIANAAVRAQAQRAERSALEAGRLAAANAEVVDFLVGLFRPLEQGQAPVQAGALAMLDSQVEGLEVRLADQPLVRASLMEASAGVYANLGLYERALPLYDRALAIRQTELGEEHRQTSELLASLASVHLEVGRPETAADLARRALAGLDDDEEATGLLTARLLSLLARAEAALGDVAGAATHLQDALGLLQSEPHGDPRLEAEILRAAARVAVLDGRGADGLALAEAAAELRGRPGEYDPADLLESLDLLGELRERAGDEAGAATLSRRAEALRTALAARADDSELPPELLLRERPSEYEDRFQAGISALQSRRLEEAVEQFGRCLELRPGSAVCDYNIACARSLEGKPDLALAALERAAAKGLGATDGRLDLLRRDADLAPLRDDPRFAALIERIALNSEAMRRYTSEVGLRPAESERPGVLMVLHADGSTREAILNGEWAGLAASMGAALLAPSAPHARGPQPAGGFDWDSAGTDEAVPPFEQRTRLIGTLNDFVESHDVDRERVVVVGEGDAARLAFDLALHAPGLVSGVLLINGPAVAEGATRRARVAAALGMRAALALESGAGPEGIALDLSPRAYAEALREWWSRCGLESPMGSEPYLSPPGTAARRTHLGELLNALGLDGGRGVGATAPGAQD